MAITRDEIEWKLDENDGTVILFVRDVPVVEVVLHGFWNGSDNYYMQPHDDHTCPVDGFMVSSWRYDGANLEEGMSAWENFRLWSQPLPTKDED